MMSTLQSKSILVIALSMLSYSAFANNNEIKVPYGTITGNAGIVTKYIYRGGVENNDLAAQGGIAYNHQSGISLGYWGSTLDYNPGHEEKSNGFEHDLYIAYGHELNPNWSYKLQATAYIYHNANKTIADSGEKRDITSYDVAANLTYKNLTAGAAVVVADSAASNAGDTYISASYSHALPQDFSLNGSVGGTAYNSSRDDAVVTTTKDFAFNEARLGVSKSFANTGLVASLDYVIGGENRLGEDYKDHVVFGLNYQF